MQYHVALLIDLTTLYQLQHGLCLFIISTVYPHGGDGYWLTLSVCSLLFSGHLRVLCSRRQA